MPKVSFVLVDETYFLLALGYNKGFKREVGWEAKRQRGSKRTLELGPSDRMFRVLTAEVTTDRTLGDWLALYDAHPSHSEFITEVFTKYGISCYIV
jgi:hypothetical protein